MSNWETEILRDVDYYKKVLLDGCDVVLRDVTMCDLRVHMDQVREDHRPMVQVYKANKGGEEYCEMFHNFEDAYKVFLKLTKKRW
jgi:hypothetical protein